MFFLFLFNHATMLKKVFGFSVSVRHIILLFYQVVEKQIAHVIVKFVTKKMPTETSEHLCTT
jgi:hypothetical protein